MDQNKVSDIIYSLQNRNAERGHDGIDERMAVLVNSMALFLQEYGFEIQRIEDFDVHGITVAGYDGNITFFKMIMDQSPPPSALMDPDFRVDDETIRIVTELLRATEELNGEFQDGWANEIIDGQRLLKRMKLAK